MPVRLGPFYLALPVRSIQRFSISAFETRSLPNAHSLLPLQLYLDHSHYLVLAPATLAALPSTRAIPDRDVFYVTHPIRSSHYFFPAFRDANVENSVTILRLLRSFRSKRSSLWQFRIASNP